jgi:peptidoglycan L-alanyl-D-glutamate endopeptidase CwlK
VKFTERDERRMAGLHPDLIRVIRRAADTTTIPFTVLEGMRTIETQRKYVARGASRTLRSRHLTGHAIDIAPLIDGEVSWAWPIYHRLAPIVKAAAQAEKVAIEWGGDWVKFRDGPHWQLPWRQYP